MSPDHFEENCNSLDSARAHLKAISDNKNWEVQNLPAESKVLIRTTFGMLTMDYPEAEAVDQLRNYVSGFPKVEPWMQYCAVDGKKGEAYKQLWLRLVQQIQDTSAYAENLTVEKFGKEVQVLSQDSLILSNFSIS